VNFPLTLELLAVIVSAIYGILLASRKGMDAVGVYAVACSVAFGGGTLRDLFLDRHPLFWIANPHYPLIILAMAMAAGFIVRHLPKIQPLLPLPDAIGMALLALFTIVGTQIALESGATSFIAALLGVMTGTFGGVIGDIICNEIPGLFQPLTPLYAICSLTGALVFIGCSWINFPSAVGSILGISTTVIFRLIVLKKNITLPALRPPPAP